MANKNSLNVRKEHRREGAGKEAELQGETIPGRGAHHQESVVMHSGGTGARDKIRGTPRARDADKIKAVFKQQEDAGRCPACSNYNA